ncbi:hypothetical protein IW15_13735 [Chryseobacterium soli]|uniref:Uncharacterized protein n=1 Tax=Chryseobacterium soli TaxID=445961 RepID=A0A086A4Z4_9FLAO|nr:hypothetical protein [Chryseobacterium soli]KFF11758.1 hypothetical protein IW15_13735 [Chryseobacterium soli]
MKKIFLYILAGSLCFSACKKDDADTTYTEPADINVQNDYDNQAIAKFMNENYLDAQGNIKAFSSTDTSDDNQTKLTDLPHTTLPSGTIYFIRAGAQPADVPTPGYAIGSTDIIRIMMKSKSYLAVNTDGNVAFQTGVDFLNTINGSTIPAVDPKFYYISDKDPLIVNATTDAAKQKSYYMIEGFNEALQKFQAFNKGNSEAYNLQGVIIVPSRAAFARDPYNNYTGSSLRNNSFVFNFQVYGTAPRPAGQ